MRALLLMVCMFSLSCWAATSDSPTPSGAKPQQEHLQDAKKTQEKSSAPAQTGQNVPPLINIVNNAQAPGTNTQQSKQQEEKSSAEWWAVGVAIVAASIAAIAALIAFAQAGLFVWQLSHMKKANETAAVAAAAALENTKLARQEFAASHRPRIILRDATSEQDMGELIVVKYILANVGDTTAKIICRYLMVKVFKGWEFGPDNLPSATDADSEPDEILLIPGQQISLVFTSPRLRWSSENYTCHIFLEEEYGMFFSGQIIYEDTIGTLRNTGFRRKFFSAQHRFLCVDDVAHYEYQD